jgi:hypothetical protein
LDAELTQLGVEHSFERYEGNHMNRIGGRFETKVLPFFSSQLRFDVQAQGRRHRSEETR